LAPNSNVIAIDYAAEKLQLAEKLGAAYTINSKESQEIRSEVFKITEGKVINAVIDCVGAEETIRDSVRILSKSGEQHTTSVNQNSIQKRECSYQCSSFINSYTNSSAAFRFSFSTFSCSYRGNELLDVNHFCFCPSNRQ
jgi:Zn-dependent alcohol dehydrogenase